MIGIFYVNRSVGIFGDVIVFWKIFGSDVNFVFEIIFGDLSFFFGDNFLLF